MNIEDSQDLSLLSPAIERFAPLGRSGLLPALHAAKKLYGWISNPVAAEIAGMLKIPLADVYGVIEFYSLFSDVPVKPNHFEVCLDPACALKGADNLFRRLENGHAAVNASPCLGICEHAPGVLLNGHLVQNREIFSDQPHEFRPASLVYGTARRLTRNCGLGRKMSLKEYGAYNGLLHARSCSQNEVIAEIKAAGLVGRGGAAFPTGAKWESARNVQGEKKFIVCNADESEPGTFKDRVILSDDPHMIIEGMLIAAYAIGASHGYLYLRGEYDYILPTLETALDEARQAGYLDNKFDIEIRLGAGAYICGEETALFESIEGKRGFPRIKPPFPTTHGLFNSPTVINNVETLSNVPFILQYGAAEYRMLGTEKSPGSKLFCVSGDISKPGVYEVPFGVNLLEILSMAMDSKTDDIQAVLFGGAAGAFADNKQLDVRLTFEDLRSAGLPLGSGVIMVFNHSRDLRDTLSRVGKFFAHESCGKCYPCQLGTRRQSEILDRIAKGELISGDLERLQDIGWTMADSSLCGLGQTAATAILSAIDKFPNIFTAGSQQRNQ